MAITGHKSKAIFDRYNIVSEKDLSDAATKIESAQLSYSLVKVTESGDETRIVKDVRIQ